MALNITETMSLTQALAAAPPGAASAPKTVSIAGMKINQAGSRVASGISTVTSTAKAIDVSALGGGILGCYAIKNLDGANNLSIQRALASPAFDTLQPGEMSMGRFDTTVTAPAAQLVPWGTMGTVTAALAAGGTLTVGAYFYVVTAVTSAGAESAQSAEATATTTAGNQTITLSWAAVPGAVSYKVYRSTTTGSYVTPALAGSPTTNSFTDAGVTLSAGAPPATPSVLMEFLICEA
jgi:hypothetical protein